ncbi:MAG: helix-turn-helix domain-containing protein [Pseudomonadota bacterium]
MHAPDAESDDSVEVAIGETLRSLRSAADVSARELAVRAGVSAAMISRIESAQVSPSISTLTALSAALDVPLVRLFRDTDSRQGDYSVVRAGQGIRSRRVVEQHVHDYENLAVHKRRDLQFEARTVTVTRQSAKPPRYVGQGVVFVQIIEGEAVYGCGADTMTLRAGDAVTLDAEMQHGFIELLSDKLVFLTIQAERRQ